MAKNQIAKGSETKKNYCLCESKRFKNIFKNAKKKSENCEDANSP